MRDQLLQELKKDLGETPTAEQVLEWMDKGALLSRKHVRPFIITRMFWAIYKDSGKTAYDVEHDVAAHFNDLSGSAVRFIRLRHGRALRKRTSK